MNAKLIYRDTKGNVNIGKFELDLDDALSTAKIILKTEMTPMVFIQTLGGRFSYYVTRRGEDYKITGTLSSNL